MRFYTLTQAGMNVAKVTTNPSGPAYNVIACLYRLRSANVEKICEYTGMDLGTVQAALSQLMCAKPPLVGIAG